MTLQGALFTPSHIFEFLCQILPIERFGTPSTECLSLLEGPRIEIVRLGSLLLHELLE